MTLLTPSRHGRHGHSGAGERGGRPDDTVVLPVVPAWVFSPREVGDEQHGEFLDLTHSLDGIIDAQDMRFHPSDTFLGLVRQLELRGPISREQPPVMARYRYRDWGGEQVDALAIRVGVDEESGRGFAYFSAQLGPGGAYELDRTAITAFQIDNDPASRQVEVFDAAQRQATLRVPIGRVIS